MRLRTCLLALALTTPGVALADDPKTTDTTQTEDKDKPTRTTMSTEDTTDDTADDVTDKTDKTDKEMVRVRAHIVPTVAGIEAADKAVAALYELAGDEQLRPEDARRTIALAKQALAMSTDRLSDLEDMSGLSSDAKSEAESAATKLKDARTTISRLERQIGKRNATISRNTTEQIRSHAKDLHDDLSEAESSVENVAKAYDVPTDLEFGT